MYREIKGEVKGLSPDAPTWEQAKELIGCKCLTSLSYACGTVGMCMCSCHRHNEIIPFPGDAWITIKFWMYGGIRQWWHIEKLKYSDFCRKYSNKVHELRATHNIFWVQ